MALSKPLLRPLSIIVAAVLSKTEIYNGHSSFNYIRCLISSAVYPFCNAMKHFEANYLCIIRGCLGMFGRGL
jgi:hypothetical protein